MASPIVIILAAGLGTRMKSDRPKVAFEVAGRPLIAWAIEAARGAGAERIVAVLGHQHERVKALIDARFGEGAIDVAIQAEQKGTGHAVMCALPALDKEPDDRIVVITSGDAPLFRADRVAQLVAACEGAPAKMSLVSSIPTRPVHYGRLVRDEHGKLLSIVEHADATPEQRAIEEVNAGFYAIELGHLRADTQTLASDNAQGELYLTDLAECAAARGGAAVLDAPFEEISGINDRADLAEVDRLARLEISRAYMREGVTIAVPDQTYIDADGVSIGKDAWIGPNVHLRGNTSVGERSRVDAGCVLIDARVGADSEIHPYSVVVDSRIGDRTSVGPFCKCGPEVKLDDDVHIGNFVEIVRSHVMAGARADQLAYLGDATIGAKANIGAGTVTCNYDGQNKYKTTIEAGAFVGSDAQLVAPITVGRDAYVGSGTTVTKDVPRSALALSRVKQVNIDDWANRFREAGGKRKDRHEP